MKICILDGKILNPGDVDWSPLKSFGELVIYDQTNPEEFLEHIQGAEILLTNKVPLKKSHLKDLPNLRFIGVLATGYDVVDINAFAEKNIPVCNVVSYCTDDVAQHTFALILELCRHISLHSLSVKNGDWKASGQWCYWQKTPISLASLTLGIIGFGATGRRVAELGHAFSMKVKAYCPNPKNPPDYPDFSFVSLEKLLATSDIISLHCPLNDHTREIINQEHLKIMKDGALLVNVSRGGLLNESDVAKALKSGKLAGLAVDVLAKEPATASNPLLNAPNTFITPHIAWATKNARQNIIDLMAENIHRWQNGTPINVVNGVE